MSKGIGRLFTVGIARETARGTAVGTPSFMIAFAELDIDEKDARVIDEQSRGIIEGSVGESIVKQWMEGQLKAPIGTEHFPLILYATFGTLSSVTGTATGTPIYHTITVQQGAQHQSLTFQLDDPLGGQDYTHANSVIGQLEIAYERETFLSYTATIRGKKGAAATVTPVAVSEKRFLPQHLTFKLATTQSGLDAASAISLKSATLRINQNIVDDDVLGNIAPADFLNKQFEIEGELEATWQNESDFKTNSLTGTARAMRLDLVNTAEVIGTGSTNPSLRIDLNKVVFQPITRPIRLGDIVTQRVAFRAHYDTTTSKMATVTATNSTTSY
jgi:hypothetical protein